MNRRRSGFKNITAKTDALFHGIGKHVQPTGPNHLFSLPLFLSFRVLRALFSVSLDITDNPRSLFIVKQ